MKAPVIREITPRSGAFLLPTVRLVARLVMSPAEKPEIIDRVSASMGVGN